MHPRELAKYGTYKVLGPVVPRLPRRAFYGLATVAGLVNYALHGAMRADLRRNVTLLFGDAKSPREREAIVREHFVHRAKHVLEAQLYPHINDPRYDDWFVYEGEWDVIARLVEEKRGVVIPTPEVGPYALAALKVQHAGLRVNDIAQDLEATDEISTVGKRLESERNATFSRVSGDFFRPSQFLRGVFERVRRGEAISIFYDARPTSQMTAAWFLGRWCRIHRGPVTIAQKTGAAILLMTSYRDRKERVHIHVGGLLELVRTGNREQDILANTQRIADYHTPWVLARPGQWVMLKEFERQVLPDPAPAPVAPNGDATGSSADADGSAAAVTSRPGTAARP